MIKILLLIFLLFSATTANAEWWITENKHYGTNNLTPLTENGVPIIHLPGGTKVKVGNAVDENEENKFILTDVAGREIDQPKEPFTVGREYEPKLGTHNVHARQYDDSAARWLSRDQIGFVPYAYVDLSLIHI